MPKVISEPTTDIQTLATLALDEPKFRAEASARGQFQQALLDHNHDILTTDAEIAFCEGWLNLARLEFGEIPDVLDRNLVIRIRAALQEAGSTRAG